MSRCQFCHVLLLSIVMQKSDSVGGERDGTCGEGLQNQELGAGEGEGQGKNLGSFLNIPPHVP